MTPKRVAFENERTPDEPIQRSLFLIRPNKSASVNLPGVTRTKNASALSEARRREIGGQREGHNGALSIKPFERSRVTTLWDLNWVFCVGWGGGGCERV